MNQRYWRSISLVRTVLQHCIVVLFAVLAFCLASSAFAQQPALANLDTLRQIAQRWANDAVKTSESADPRLRMEVLVAPLDTRLQLPACAQVEAYLPVGTRLWGRSRVGLRCTDGVARWNVTAATQVKAFGPAWVVRNGIRGGSTVSDDDVVQAEVDWAEEPTAVLQDRNAWRGQVATRMLNAGQALRQGMVKASEVFQAGTPLRVIAQGDGFQVSGEALAVSSGVVGQMAKIKFDNGRVVSAQVVDSRTVRIDL
ncbi:flagellar basal body P-ring formation protein FlgA [Curvibacter sp. CHRR-16]|uniref:flagellar basal body P-ring formation chaperone FlgA n=1 Tax=Curvibacter sp. CHRR-16 TaxID=2835872 RepID=UPI001BDADE2A|nr:flagellar basal body P-ring formation chaperone FlgA [Curvibacter sp. CHRR-16]MBT0569545.1 flagellar basal body P-ring formation protein FlgA [Curvibacter sp. CHRR-16]